MVDTLLSFSHLAVLVPSVEKAASVLREHGFKTGPAEVFEEEGTLEIYVGDYETQSALLLLMEPVRENSSYGRALKKRGPGIHHIAIDVLNIEEYVKNLSGSGWFLHMNSLHTLKHMNTVYLARPLMPTMIEVQQREKISKLPSLVNEVVLPLDEAQGKVMNAVGVHAVRAGKEISFNLNQKKFKLSDLL